MSCGQVREDIDSDPLTDATTTRSIGSSISSSCARHQSRAIFLLLGDAALLRRCIVE
ncbi:MAG: hypothetical protein JW807_00720 [Spirochaetes bacterium]|nr:hypothetical protein [Spirochaetota bacterium]